MERQDLWPRVKDIFGAALDRGLLERQGFVDNACAGNESLRREVESLLASYEEGDDLFRNSDLFSVGMLPGLEEPPKAIGPYRLVRELGAGGMGQVWLAEQTEPVRRQVAIKLIRGGFFSPQITQRFLAERQSLALMNHPAIAKVFDAGSTSSGQPYLVMEYVDGVAITDYCDQHRLTTADRLALVQQVCDGVQHAHQKAIIHRDLKPSNILVTVVDGRPVPRVIDFGVAKPVVQDIDGHTRFTQVGTMIGTLGYMSPEQADSGGEDIDTRSDVYSLGVVLYELLVGALPHDLHRLTYSEALRRLREEDAPLPSTSIRLSEDSLATAQKRGTELPALIRQLRGDADAIARKALEKDRDCRYATPAELAADIDRYLNHEPVAARVPHVGYLVRKYVRRHRVGVALALAGVLLMIGFSVAQTWQLRNTRRQRDRADRIADFMIGIFNISNPFSARGKTITAREVLDNGAKQISTQLKDDPELQASMMYHMANTYYTLGLFSQSQPLLEQALGIQRRILGTRHPETLQTMTLLGGLLSDEGHYTEAEKIQRQTLVTKQKVLGSKNRETLLAAWWLATTLSTEQKLPEAEKLFRDTLEMQRRMFGLEDTHTAMSMDGLGYVLQQEGHYPEAENLYRESIAINRRKIGPDAPNVASSMSNLANTLLYEKRFAEAEKQYRDTLAIQNRIIGPEHPDTINTLTNLGVALDYNGRHAEAERIHRRTYDIEKRNLGPDHRETLMTEGYIAIEMSETGRYPEAEQIFKETILAAARGNEPGVLANTWYGFACGAAMAGRKEDALLYLTRAVDKELRGQDLEGEPYLNSLHGDQRFQALRVRLGQATSTDSIKPA